MIVEIVFPDALWTAGAFFTGLALGWALATDFSIQLMRKWRGK